MCVRLSGGTSQDLAFQTNTHPATITRYSFGNQSIAVRQDSGSHYTILGASRAYFVCTDQSQGRGTKRNGQRFTEQAIGELDVGLYCTNKTKR